jgi:hypothetical protein
MGRHPTAFQLRLTKNPEIQDRRSNHHPSDHVEVVRGGGCFVGLMQENQGLKRREPFADDASSILRALRQACVKQCVKQPGRRYPTHRGRPGTALNPMGRGRSCQSRRRRGLIRIFRLTRSLFNAQQV